MKARIDTALAAMVVRAQTGAPATLASALHHAVFPGGARIRPQLCLAVAEACGGADPALADAVAVSLELVHCASLVHDDLPCFDDADSRRGRASVHRAFGEPIAVLAGDGLIALAFEAIARAGVAAPARLPALVTLVARAVGSPHGLVAGQAWESEASIDLGAYHRAKTGSLFTAATMGGAIVAGRDPAPWRAMGAKLGEAYQVADDLMDALASKAEAGKPTGQDAAHSRPNAVARMGVDGAIAHLRELVAEAASSVPDCAGAGPLRGLVLRMAEHLVPASRRQSSAA